MKPYANLVLLCALLTLCACKTLEQRETGVRIVVTYGTAKFIEKAGTAEAQAARAEKIRTVAQDIRTFMEGNTVTLGLLEAAIRDRLPANLSPADRVLVNELIALIMMELRAKMDDGLLKPEQKVIVVKVIDWVTLATG
jgi:hypothetical protein